MTGKVECGEHGTSEATYTCVHLKQTAQDGTPRGFHWIRDDEGEIQAFCDHCWDADDEEWEKISAEGPRLLCLDCLKNIARINALEMETDRPDG